jgi:L-threonylcarbamoyladenylate synthase
VFGLGCDPLNSKAVLKLLDIKKRSVQKGLILIAADFSQLAPYIKDLPTSVISRIHDLNQQPTTWLLPVKDSVPQWLTGGNKKIAVRLVQHDLAKELCALAGTALVSTSANVTGCEPLKTAYQTRLKFHRKGVYIINARVGNAQQPSRIIDPLSNKQIR